MKKLFPLLFVIALYSCGSHTRNTGSTTDSSTVETTVPTGSFYKRYAGTIAGKKVVVHLERFGTQVQGCYQYVGVSQALSLSSWEDTVNDNNLYLTETYGNGSSQDSLPHWTVALVPGGIKGKWNSGNGLQQYDIDLKEEYPDGSYRLNAIYIKDSARLFEGKPTPFAAASYAALTSPGNDDAGKFINEQVSKALDIQDPDLAKGLREGLKAYFDQYRKDNLELSEEIASADELWAYNFTRDEVLSVLYNDRGWLIVEDLASDYTGGAHGNSTSSFINMDVQGRKVWGLNDVLTDTVAIKPLLNLTARNYFHLKEGEDADQAMLVEEVPPTGNFFLLPEGITFVYNPYEVASYADGEVQLYIPYKKLLSFLTPAFKVRMHLSESTGVASL